MSGEPASTGRDALRDWEAVRASTDVQFAPVTLPRQTPPKLPGWLERLGDWLESLFKPLGRWLGVSWPVLEKLVIALAVVAAALLVWRLIVLLLALRRKGPPAAPADWAPDRQQAAALLDDADRLAGLGQFDAAVHLLLVRSVAQIGAARPDSLRPASTARDIAALPFLPDRARRAFGIMAERVERSLFALRSLDLADWQAARAAYADFALEPL